VSEATQEDVSTERLGPGLGTRVTVMVIPTLAICQFMRWVSITFFDPDEPTAASRLVGGLVVFGLVVPLVITARRYLDQRPWSGIRLTVVRERRWPFLVGAGWWLIPASAGMSGAGPLLQSAQMDRAVKAMSSSEESVEGYEYQGSGHLFMDALEADYDDEGTCCSGKGSWLSVRPEESG